MTDISSLPTFTLIRSNRRTLSLEISPLRGLVVRSPRAVDESVIRSFVVRKARWIARHIARLMNAESLPTLRPIDDGVSLLYLGQEYPVTFVKHSSRGVYFKAGFFIPEIQKHRARAVLLAWYRAEALRVVTSIVCEYQQRYAIECDRIRITNAKTRWGSCGARNTLNFSWRIIMAPPSIVAYVVAHELAHVAYKHHRASFWRRVAVLCPQYRDAHRWLKEHGARLTL